MLTGADAITRMVPESERRIRGIVSGFEEHILQDSRRTFRMVRAKGIFCSLSEVEGVLEKVRQEHFAKAMGEPSFLSVTTKPKEPMSKDITKKEKLTMPKTIVKPLTKDELDEYTRGELAQMKRDYMIDTWKENMEIPKDTMKKTIHRFFKSGIDWPTLTSCKSLALEELTGGKVKARTNGVGRGKAARNGTAKTKTAPKKKMGRPKGSKNKAKAMSKGPKKRMGRPKGSKNKIKTRASNKPRVSNKPKFNRHSNALQNVLSILGGVGDLEGVKVNVSISFE